MIFDCIGPEMLLASTRPTGQDYSLAVGKGPSVMKRKEDLHHQHFGFTHVGMAIYEGWKRGLRQRPRLDGQSGVVIAWSFLYCN